MLDGFFSPGGILFIFLLIFLFLFILQLFFYGFFFLKFARYQDGPSSTKTEAFWWWSVPETNTIN